MDYTFQCGICENHYMTSEVTGSIKHESLYFECCYCGDFYLLKYARKNNYKKLEKFAKVLLKSADKYNIREAK